MQSNIKASSIFRDPYLFCAFGFGSGLSPKAPGTAGTLIAVPLYLLLIQANSFVYAMFVLLTAILGVWICQEASDRLGVHDHGGIVWDEMVGFWITMFAVPPGVLTISLGFVLFRVFDIAKPWPINLADQKVGGGLGIMLDDVLAAVYANLCLQGLLLIIMD